MVRLLIGLNAFHCFDIVDVGLKSDLQCLEVTVTLGKWVTFYNVQLNDAASRNVLQ